MEPTQLTEPIINDDYSLSCPVCEGVVLIHMVVDQVIDGKSEYVSGRLHFQATFPPSVQKMTVAYFGQCMRCVYRKEIAIL